MRRSPDVSPRRLSDISPQLRQLKYLVVDEAIKEDLKWSRSVEDLTSGPVGLTSIEERILRITGYYGYQPWATSYKSKTPYVIPLPTGGLHAGDTTARKVHREDPLNPLSYIQIGNFDEETCLEALAGVGWGGGAGAGMWGLSVTFFLTPL